MAALSVIPVMSRAVMILAVTVLMKMVGSAVTTVVTQLGRTAG